MLESEDIKETVIDGDLEEHKKIQGHEDEMSRYYVAKESTGTSIQETSRRVIVAENKGSNSENKFGSQPMELNSIEEKCKT